ncbi:hypothetical protein TNCV_294621 [Trichonephila clavipes]|nr:hypothetical protein TNCV_294621 [Trichonephila clavipes]
MAGKVMFLRSNQGGRLDSNESVADSFEVIWSALKAGPRQFSGLLLLLRLPKTLHCREAHLLPEVNPIRRSLPLSKLSNIQLCVT